MVLLSRLSACVATLTATASATVVARLSKRAVSNARMTWICPGTQFDGDVVELITAFNSVWANKTVGPYGNPDFSIKDNGVLMSGAGKQLCLVPNSGSYYIGDPTGWPSFSGPCPDTDHFGLYRGAYLTWGGGYDMFCLGCSDQDCAAGDGLLAWKDGIPAYEEGNSPCRFRGRISVNGYSVQPAPATPIKPTTTPPPPSTTSSPTTTPTTSGPVTSPPPPGDTRTPNPTVKSAVSSASSKVSSVSKVVSSYLNNPSSSPLAQMAEDSSENGIVFVYQAQAIADSFSISNVAKNLDDAASKLFKVAAALVFARTALTAEAASAVSAALVPVADSMAAAAAAAADPVQNPSPTASKPTSTSTTSTTSYVCSINIATNDAVLAQPSSTDEPVKRNSVMDLEERAAQAAGTGRGRFCNVQYNVPAYNSYSGTGVGNTYNYYFNYYSSNQCGIWDFDPLSGTSPSTFVTPRGDQIPDSSGYATEHIYEIQSIPIFFEYAWRNDPYLKTLYTSTDQFCNNTNSLGVLLRSTGQFSSYQPYDYNTAPMQQFFNQLQSNNSEFVYLESKLNNVKGVLFGSKNPGTESTYERALPVASRIAVVSEYLNDPKISGIYKTVSNRIRQSIINFGQACNVSTDSRYRQFGNVTWAGLYDKWENAYFDDITTRMRAAALGNSDAAIANIQKYIRDQGAAFQQRVDYTKLQANVLNIESVQGPIAAINLNKLRRS